MKQDKIISLLGRLSGEEMKKFNKYIRLKYEAGSLLVKLIKYLRKFHPHFEAESITKQVILKKVLQLEFSSKSAKRLSNEAHKLYDDLIDFLILEKLNSNKILRDKLIIDLLRERKLDDLFYKKTASTKKQILSSPQSIWTMLDLFTLNHKEYYYAPMQKISFDIDPLYDANYCLDKFYELAKLKYFSEDNNRTNILASQATLEDKNPNSSIEQIVSGNISFLKDLYSKILELNKTRDTQVYEYLKEILLTKHTSITKKDQLTLITYLINKANSDFKKGDHSGIVSAFEFFKFCIEHQIFIESGFISAGNFRNIVFTACEIQEFYWAIDFMEAHQKYLVQDERKDIIAVSKSRIAFGQRDFYEAIALLSKVDLKNSSYKLLVKFIQIRCYYEVNNKQLCTDAVKSFEQFLRRDKTLSNNTIIAYQSFLIVLRLLLPRKKKWPPSKIKEKLLNQRLIAGKSWLLSKIAELS